MLFFAIFEGNVPPTSVFSLARASARNFGNIGLLCLYVRARALLELAGLTELTSLTGGFYKNTNCNISSCSGTDFGLIDTP